MLMAQLADYSRIAFDLVDEFERARSVERVMGLLSAALRKFGFESFLVTGVPEPPQRLEPYILMNGWSEEWSSHYMKEDYYIDDPVAAWCRQTINPFEWSEAEVDLQRRPRAGEVMQTAADFGMKHGFLVPVLRSSGFCACVSMAGEHPDLEARAKRAIHLISLFAHARITLLQGTNAVVQSGGPGLTKREREVLTWIAVGKTSWEIAKILGITERTVNWLVAQASRKLDAVTRTQAVVNAIRRDVIQL